MKRGFNSEGPDTRLRVVNIFERKEERFGSFMGNYKSSPLLGKDSKDGENDFIKYGSSTMQGWRAQMQDFVYTNLNVIDGAAMFAVYDGHGGAAVAEYCCENMPDLIRKNWKPNNIFNTLKESFCELDISLKDKKIMEKLELREAELSAGVTFTKADVLKEGKSVLRSLRLCRSSDEGRSSDDGRNCDQQSKNDVIHDEFLRNSKSRTEPNLGYSIVRVPPLCKKWKANLSSSSHKGYHVIKHVNKDVYFTVGNLVERVADDLKDENESGSMDENEFQPSDEEETQPMDEDGDPDVDDNNDSEGVSDEESEDYAEHPRNEADVLRHRKSVLRSLRICRSSDAKRSSDEGSRYDDHSQSDDIYQEFLRNVVPRSQPSTEQNEGPSSRSDKGYHGKKIYVDTEVFITISNLVKKVANDMEDENKYGSMKEKKFQSSVEEETQLMDKDGDPNEDNDAAEGVSNEKSGDRGEDPKDDHVCHFHAISTDVLGHQKSVLRSLRICRSSKEGHSSNESSNYEDQSNDEFLRNVKPGTKSKLGYTIIQVPRRCNKLNNRSSSEKSFDAIKLNKDVILTRKNLVEKGANEMKAEENMNCPSASKEERIYHSAQFTDEDSPLFAIDEEEAQFTDEDALSADDDESESTEDETQHMDEDDYSSEDDDESDYEEDGDVNTKNSNAGKDLQTTDEDTIKENESLSYRSGCTALVVIIYNKHLYVANAGDSKCIIGEREGPVTVSTQSIPTALTEAKRIKKAGGNLSEGRVAGLLNVSRGLGDHKFKKKTLSAEEQMISPVPIVTDRKLTDDTQYIFLVSDGVWEGYISAERMDNFMQRLQDTPLSHICEELFDLNVAKELTKSGAGCDNMSSVLITLKQKDKLGPN